MALKSIHADLMKGKKLDGDMIMIFGSEKSSIS